MSYDRQIDQVCQHTVVNEALYVGADRMTIRPLKAIAAGSHVQVFLNGSLTVPSTGVSLAPSLRGTRSGMISIATGINDRFRIFVNQEAIPREVVVPSSTLTMDQLVAILNASNLGVGFFNVSGNLEVKGYGTGNRATFFIPSDSTLSTYLGMPVSLECRGKDIVSGWTLVHAPGVLMDRPLRYIVLDRPLPSSGDFVEITYTTVQQDCRRCGGLGVEHDWRYTRTGEVIEVRDEALLIQEMLKILFTEEGSNPFHSWYGTRLVDQIGQKIGVGSLVQNLIVSDIYRAFGRWQSIKRQQELSIGQTVSDEEYPFRLLSVDAQQSQQDPTVFFVSVTVQNRSSRAVVLERGIRIPEPADLLGSTQQEGIYRQSLKTYTLTG